MSQLKLDWTKHSRWASTANSPCGKHLFECFKRATCSKWEVQFCAVGSDGLSVCPRPDMYDSEADAQAACEQWLRRVTEREIPQTTLDGVPCIAVPIDVWLNEWLNEWPCDFVCPDGEQCAFVARNISSSGFHEWWRTVRDLMLAGF